MEVCADVIQALGLKLNRTVSFQMLYEPAKGLLSNLKNVALAQFRHPMDHMDRADR